jgi:DNA-binding response OmpR family regulator
VVIHHGEITLDPAKHMVTRNGTDLQLTRREFTLLHVKSREIIDAFVEQIWMRYIPFF